MSTAPLALPLDITASACPPWCQRTEHHGYDSESATDEFRYHAVTIATRAFGDRVSVTLEITVQESRSLTTGEATLTEPGITVWYDLEPGSDNPVVTADEAQQIADLLHTAAVKLDEIKAAQ